jgi:hypothetical protein
LTYEIGKLADFVPGRTSMSMTLRYVLTGEGDLLFVMHPNFGIVQMSVVKFLLYLMERVLELVRNVMIAVLAGAAMATFHMLRHDDRMLSPSSGYFRLCAK